MKQEQKTIGDHVYTVSLLGAKNGTRMITTLIRVLGPSVAGLAAGGKGKDSAVDFGAFAQGLAAAQGLEATVEKVIQDLAKASRVTLPDGNQPVLWDVYDMHFPGRYGELVGWLAFALEANFGSFFTGPGADVLGISLGVGSGSGSPSDATG